MKVSSVWRGGLAAAVAVVVLAGPLQASVPTSRGEQFLSIPEPDCMRRAYAAFEAEGWSSIAVAGRHVGAQKAIHSAYIACNATATGVVVNIFVASERGDGGVPGLERERLQARMDPGAVAAGGGPAGVIQVIEGTYGANCRAERNNVVADLAASCNGRASCQYKVDYTRIGDPANGCQKDYTAAWSCGPGQAPRQAVAGPEAGFGSIVTLSCEGAAGPPPPMASGLIQVVEGTYGANCRAARNNVGADLAASCNGRATCQYKVDYTRIGDPANGCQKDYAAVWTCGPGQAPRQATAGPEAGFGSIVTLSCEGAAPPVVSSGIEVLEGTYGANCKASVNNVGADLAASCNGRASCDYKVDYTRIGDPAYGCQKDYRAVWRCNGGAPRMASAAPEAGFGSVVKLSCP